jgi:hypothetical protein
LKTCQEKKKSDSLPNVCKRVFCNIFGVQEFFFVKWVAFLEWGLDWLQLVSQKIPKHPKTSRNILKHHLRTMEETVEVGACCDLRFLAEFFSLWFGLLFVGEA